MINQNKQVLFIAYLDGDIVLLATESRLTGTGQGQVLLWKEHQSQTEANLRTRAKASTFYYS